MAAMLKEWSSVVSALESGEQSVLLRKGGILETASGFRVEARRFWLYPTWEHQAPDNVREEFRQHLERGRPPRGTNTITSYAEVVGEADVESADAVRRLEPLHIWSREYVEARRGWEPQRPLKAVLLRVFRTPPASIPVLAEYSGCKSWLEMDGDADGGRPVLDDTRAADIREQFRSITS
ncbi:MAG: DUF1802 family protein [Nitrosopumilaceae archaeon]|nr:DUF1802 family protein [Nitrosopumilaceae archaeon]